MRTWFLHARESFWFLPTLFGLGAVLLALGLTEVDRLLLAHGIRSIPLITDLSATGGRAILTVIGGTMLGVAATSFSITISVLATTSSAYGPRLVRNFMADRGNQLVLAVLTSTFLYTLVVLRAVRTEQDSTSAFVPVIAVTFAVILALVDVAVLVYFIHHIASSVQVTTLQTRVLQELLAVIDLLYPKEPGRTAAPLPLEDLWVEETFAAAAAGYVQYVDIDNLIEFAESNRTIIRVLTPPGTYVLEGQPIAESLNAKTSDKRAGSRPNQQQTDAEDSTKKVMSAISIDSPRTPHQDLLFAAQGLTEIGVRGLASGTNDPYTAVAAIDALSSALVTLCTRPPASNRVPGKDGELRVICEWPTPPEVIADTLQAIRTYGMQHPLVVRAASQLLQRIASVTAPPDRQWLREEVTAFRTAHLATNPAPFDASATLGSLDKILVFLSRGADK
ncbi:DUF2254 domain-containing protein [Microbacterium sp. KSW2-21]|uniref:DUF2254 domain-containing protein n=1 Tax=Microbacterium algihabitans TaxID=3075992 RepID=A0ABU3S0A7_9MICO|nr:DUF2254 domain-containing protein [Microbacterium sp. KSW2-21]MDU0328542.1 DUF2254 domain-containing protein [Microbacterium sp. KSW2-21]